MTLVGLGVSCGISSSFTLRKALELATQACGDGEMLMFGSGLGRVFLKKNLEANHLKCWLSPSKVMALTIDAPTAQPWQNEALPGVSPRAAMAGRARVPA
jgi:hypothetical protein